MKECSAKWGARLLGYPSRDGVVGNSSGMSVEEARARGLAEETWAEDGRNESVPAPIVMLTVPDLFGSGQMEPGDQDVDQTFNR